MDLRKAIGGRYLKSSDVDDPVLMTIRAVTWEEMQDGEHKAVLWFKEDERGLVINTTNGNVLMEYLGTDTDAFSGREIVVYSADTQFGGKDVKGLRLRRPKNAKTFAETQIDETVSEGGSADDDVPF